MEKIEKLKKEREEVILKIKAMECCEPCDAENRRLNAINREIELLLSTVDTSTK